MRYPIRMVGQKNALDMHLHNNQVHFKHMSRAQNLHSIDRKSLVAMIMCSNQTNTESWKRLALFLYLPIVHQYTIWTFQIKYIRCYVCWTQVENNCSLEHWIRPKSCSVKLKTNWALYNELFSKFFFQYNFSLIFYVMKMSINWRSWVQSIISAVFYSCH